MHKEKKVSSEQQAKFNDPTNLTKWVKIFIYTQMAIAIIAIISGALEYQFLSDFKNGVYTSQELVIEDGEASDARQKVVGIVQAIIFIITGILILKWIYRANYNSRQLGATGMKFTPGMSIGWYFIPIASLWKPYQAMKEIWKTSSNPQDWGAQPTSSLFPWWWLFWIVYSLLGNTSFRLAIRAEEINEFIAANIVTQLSDITVIPLSFILVSIINKVHEMQVSYAKNAQSI